MILLGGSTAVMQLLMPHCDSDMYMYLTRTGAQTASSLVPRLFGGGGKRAWYILRAHARNRPDIPRPPDSICTRP